MTAECQGGATCSCDHLVPAESLHAEHHMLTSWRSIEADLPDLLDNGAQAIAADRLAGVFIQHGERFRSHLRRELGPENANLAHVARLRALAATHDDPDDEHRMDHHKALRKLGGKVAAADEHAKLLGTLRAAIELSGIDRPVSLSAGPEPVAPVRHPGSVPQVMVPTLAHGPTRDKLKLAGHPSTRKSLGYGRLHRGAAVDDAAEVPEKAEASETVPGAGAGEGRSGPQGGADVADTSYGGETVALRARITSPVSWKLVSDADVTAYPFYSPGKNPRAGTEPDDRVPDHSVTMTWDADSRFYLADLLTSGYEAGDWTWSPVATGGADNLSAWEYRTLTVLA